MLKDVMFKTFKCINTYKLRLCEREDKERRAICERAAWERWEFKEVSRRLRASVFIYFYRRYTLFNCSNMHLSMFCIYYLHVCERVRPNGSPFIIDTPFQVGWEHARKHRPVSLSLTLFKQLWQLSFSALSH